MKKLRSTQAGRRAISLVMIYLLVILNLAPLHADEGTVTAENTPAGNQLGEAALTQTLNKPFAPGDGLWVSTFPDTTSFLNQTFPIDDGGFVTFPLVGKVQVSQMTEEQLVAFIKKNFEIYSRSPNVEVRPMLRMSMIGGFARPGLYYVDYDMSFWNAVQLSGGPLREDGVAKLQWERNGETLKDDLFPEFQRAISLKNMGFKSGDIVWTPSPDALTTWDVVVRDVLPVLAFATSMFMVWISYQQIFILTQSQGR